MEYLYIVLIKAHTDLGKISRFISGYEYSHIAVSFDNSLTDFVSFSRKTHYNPLDAGFMHEYRSYYAFGLHKHFKAKVFRLPVTSENMSLVKKTVRHIENDGKYIFNLFSMITMPIFHGFYIYNTHNCMSFTGLLIKQSECVEMAMPYYKYSISDIDKLLNEYLYFEGYLKKDDTSASKYMEKPNVLTLFYAGAKTVGGLFYRIISRRKCGRTTYE